MKGTFMTEEEYKVFVVAALSSANMEYNFGRADILRKERSV